MNARGIPTAAYQALHPLSCPRGVTHPWTGGTPSLDGGYPIPGYTPLCWPGWGTPYWDLARVPRHWDLAGVPPYPDLARVPPPPSIITLWTFILSLITFTVTIFFRFLRIIGQKRYWSAREKTLGRTESSGLYCPLCASIWDVQFEYKLWYKVVVYFENCRKEKRLENYIVGEFLLFGSFKI